MHVRHQREVRPVGCLGGDGHTDHQAKGLGLGVGIEKADDAEEGAVGEAEGEQPRLPSPERAARPVQGIADEAAEGPRDEVQQAVHGRPVPGAGLAEGGELVEVVGAQEGDDGDLGAEGAEVGSDQGDGGERGDGLGGLRHRRFLDELPAGCGEEILLGDDGVVGVVAGRRGWLVKLDLVVGGAPGFPAAGVGLGGADEHVPGGQLLIQRAMSGGPCSGRRVWTEKDHSQGGGDDQDEGDEEGDPPRDPRSQVLRVDERVEDCRHDEVGHATTCVAPTGRESVGGSDDVLVEECGRPDFASDERRAEDAGEASQNDQAGGAGHGSSQGGRDCTSDQDGDVSSSRTKPIAGKTSDDTENATGTRTFSNREGWKGLKEPTLRSERRCLRWQCLAAKA